MYRYSFSFMKSAKSAFDIEINIFFAKWARERVCVCAEKKKAFPIKALALHKFNFIVIILIIYNIRLLLLLLLLVLLFIIEDDIGEPRCIWIKFNLDVVHQRLWSESLIKTIGVSVGFYHWMKIHCIFGLCVKQFCCIEFSRKRSSLRIWCFWKEKK